MRAKLHQLAAAAAVPAALSLRSYEEPNKERRRRPLWEPPAWPVLCDTTPSSSSSSTGFVHHPHPVPHPVPNKVSRFSKWNSTRRHKELKHRLIKDTDFVYSCVCRGRLSDSYSLEGELGWGAFGTIYLGKHRLMEYYRAIKKIKKDPDDPEMVRLLMNEVHALMDLDHPNVVKLVRYYDDGQDLYLVFELCEGPDLRDRILKGKMEEKEAASVLRGMLRGLKCCHDHYMGHFDVKPENFMFSTKDMTNLKLIDLGLSSGFKRDSREIRGTADYMAPEVWDGIYGPEADVWSCGAVFYAMLTGEPLLPALKKESAIRRLVKDRAWIRQRLRAAASCGISEEAEDLLRLMLQHDRHRRPTVREALSHPFLNLKDDDLPPAFKKEAQQVLERLVEDFRTFGAEPVLKRAALLLMAHVGAYNFEETRPHRSAFSMLDRNADGELSIEALESHYLHAGMPVPEDLETAFGSVDVNDDGYISYVEFLSATLPECVRRKENLCRVVFNILDRDADGFITIRDLATAFRHGEDKEGVCIETLAEVCGPGGRLTYDMFRALIVPGEAQSVPPPGTQ